MELRREIAVGPVVAGLIVLNMGSGKLRRAAFLDRDGVLNVDHGFVVDTGDFEWHEGAQDAIRYLNDAGYLTVVVTNQSGIARGYFTEAQFRALHQWVDERLREAGARIDAVYFCPHLPDAAVPAYRRDCGCRKPRPGMLLQAIGELGIDPASSFLIGDKPRDCAAAECAGVAPHLFGGADLLDFVREIVTTAHPGAGHPSQ